MYIQLLNAGGDEPRFQRDPGSGGTNLGIMGSIARTFLHRMYLRLSDWPSGLEIPEEQFKVHKLWPTILTAGRRQSKAVCKLRKTAFPGTPSLRRCRSFVLTVMEGGVMQARAHRAVEPFDASVNHLREYFRLMVAQRESENSNKRFRSGGATTMKRAAVFSQSSS